MYKSVYLLTYLLTIVSTSDFKNKEGNAGRPSLITALSNPKDLSDFLPFFSYQPVTFVSVWVRILKIN